MQDRISEVLSTPVSGSVDVVVAGAGPAGIGAALGARKAGAEVLLVDRHGFAGGMLTAGNVLNIRQYTDGERPVIAGVAAELADRLLAAGAAVERPERRRALTHDPESTKFILQQLLTGAGVRVLFDTWVAGTAGSAGRVEGVVLENKGGRSAVRAAVTVDATGDGDVIARSGAAFVRRPPSEAQPMTLAFVLGGVADWPNSFYTDENQAKVKAAMAAGTYPSLAAPAPFPTPRPGCVYVNGTRVAGDCTDPADLTRASMEARRQAFAVADWLRRNIKGYEGCHVALTAPAIGLRESRRLVGLYTMTRDDILSHRHFADDVAVGAYGIDVHAPDRPGGEMIWLDAGKHYGIPYRALVPETVDGLLAAGRCLSADPSALGSVRVMATCMATGQAAGAAAALAARAGAPPRHVDVATLRTALRAQGAIVSMED